MDCSKRLTPSAGRSASSTSKNEHRGQARCTRARGQMGMDESHGGDIGDMAVPNHGSECAAME